MEEIKEILEQYLDQNLFFVIMSNTKQPEKITKSKIRPVMIKGQLFFQIEEFIGKQVFHQNKEKKETISYILKSMEENFKQFELDSLFVHGNFLVSKKGKITTKLKKKTQQQIQENKDKNDNLSHNRKKQYVLEENIPVPFLVDLGVQTIDGKIVKSKYDKFRQINRYLEFVKDVLPNLPKDRTVTILDFGCGKSYLTFALYYYLKEVEKFDIRVIGLDLKEEVIKKCNQLAKRFGFDSLSFHVGDISNFTGIDKVDMVVTLHACDVATDYALEKAVKWGAEVIFSVPCCQHELHNQMNCKELESIMKYGLIQERMAALLTDALRANMLEEAGYDTQILEFIDMEHTPKNILIRAMKKHGRSKMGKVNSGEISQAQRSSIHKEIDQVSAFFGVDPTLRKLLQNMEK